MTGECRQAQTSQSQRNKDNRTPVCKYQIPPLVTGLPFLRNEFGESRKNKKWMRWVYEMSIMEKCEYARIKHMAAPSVPHMYPLCSDEDRYETVHKMIFLSHVYDFHIEVGNATQLSHSLKCFDEMTDKLEDLHFVSMQYWPLYVTAHFAVFDRVFFDYNPDQKARLIGVLRRYNQGIREEIEFNTSEQKFTDIQQYLQIRCKSVAARVLIQMLEFTDNIALSEEVWTDSRWQRIMELVEICTVYLNDMLTFEKDLVVCKRFDEMSNSVALIAHLEGIPEQESMERVSKLVVDYEKEFVDLGQDLINDKECATDTKAMINSVTHLLGGIFELHRVNM